MFFNSTRLTLIPQGSVATSKRERIWVLISSREVKVVSKSMEPIILRRVVAVKFSIAAMGFSTP